MQTPALDKLIEDAQTYSDSRTRLRDVLEDHSPAIAHALRLGAVGSPHCKLVLTQLEADAAQVCPKERS